MSHVRTKTENVSQNENVQSCHHGANLSLPTNISVCLKGKEAIPLHAMQYYLYLLNTKTTESLYLPSMAGQQIMDYKKVESRNVVLPVIIYTVTYKKFLEIVQNTPTDIF